MIPQAADSLAARAVDSVEMFVGDPVKLGIAMAAFAIIYGLGAFCALWILVRSHNGGGEGGKQASLTKLGIVVFGIAISAFVWMMFSAAFLGVGSYEDAVELARWLMTLGLLGAVGVKVGTTVLSREQIRHGQKVTEEET